MSYEGYTQILCQDGHEYYLDVWEHGSCKCGKPPVWKHEVDLTNGCYCNESRKCPAHPVELEILEEAVYEECKECHHEKLVSSTRYRIPA